MTIAFPNQIIQGKYPSARHRELARERIRTIRKLWLNCPRGNSGVGAKRGPYVSTVDPNTTQNVERTNFN